MAKISAKQPHAPSVKQAQKLQLDGALPGFSSVGGGGLRKRNALSRAQRSNAFDADYADFHVDHLPSGADESRCGTPAHSSRTPDMAFPGAAAYALLVLTNLVFNSFGGDGGGIQFFYASPVRFRQIMLGKNLTHAGILVAERRICLDRGHLSLWTAPPRGHHRYAGGTYVCRAPELHRRKPAVDLHA